MAAKDQIINNLREYSASEIVHAIKCGEVSMYELSKSGKLTPLMKKRIEEQMACDSVEINSTGSVIESSEEILPSVTANLEELTPAQPEIPTNPIVAPVLPSQSSEEYSEILDNKGMFCLSVSFPSREEYEGRNLGYHILYFLYGIFYLQPLQK